MTQKIYWVGILVFLIVMNASVSAQPYWKDRKLYLNEDGSNYFKLTFAVQPWLRNMQYNPGTTIFGYPKKGGTDIGIRRYRVQLIGQLTDRILIYSQFGENNFNSIADRKQGFFIHDAVGEYAFIKTKLSLGMGLSGWSGLARFSSPSIGTLMGIDAPVFLQTTNDATDQFLRKLEVYMKGKLGKIDYRFTMAQPMAIQKSANYSGSIGNNFNFSALPPTMQWNGYIQYQFKDQEANLLPYNAGTYLGKKKVFNIGAGFIYQPHAMWKKSAFTGDTLTNDMLHLSIDIFYDIPLDKKGRALSIYSSVSNYNFGASYFRNLGIMNPANGTNNSTILNGGGNAFPAYGTGTVFYLQAGYKCKDNLIGKTTLMPYMCWQHANYDAFKQDVNFYDLGINWLVDGHQSKFTLAFQNRPVYTTDGNLLERKSAIILQYQVSF